MAMTSSSGPVRSISSAAAFVNRAGLALVFPNDNVVLPSLWEAAVGTGEVIVFVRDEHGRRVLSPELRRVWSWHERLAAQRRACVGKHIRNRLALISLELLPALYASTGRQGRLDDFRAIDAIAPLELDLAEALLDAGPRTGPDLRRLLGLRDAARTKRALEGLQRDLVITRAGEAEQAQGWDAAVFDLVARRYQARLRRLPEADNARVQLAAAVLGQAGELSVADLAAVLHCRRPEATAALDQLVDLGRARRRDVHPPVWATHGS
jgi:hypothetical protein